MSETVSTASSVRNIDGIGERALHWLVLSGNRIAVTGVLVGGAVGSALARRDLAEDFATSLDDSDAPASGIDDLMETVALDASTYASEVGHF